MRRFNCDRETAYQLVGWVMFIVCALLFILSSLRSRDPIAPAASLVFLAACFVFMVPLFEHVTKK